MVGVWSPTGVVERVKSEVKFKMLRDSNSVASLTYFLTVINTAYNMSFCHLSRTSVRTIGTVTGIVTVLAYTVAAGNLIVE